MANKNILGISEAASIALHTMMYLGKNPNEPLSTKDLALALKVSEAHLSKVLQRLAKVYLVQSIRGPSGGFKLGNNTQNITILDVLEAIDGPFKNSNCLMKHSICKSPNECFLGNLLHDINIQVEDYFSSTKIISHTLSQ